MTVHLTWPLGLTFDQAGRCSYAQVEQDSPAEIRQSAALLCELREGDLAWNETLGIPDPGASVDALRAAQEIEQTVRDVEKRARFSVEIAEDGDQAGRLLRLRMSA